MPKPLTAEQKTAKAEKERARRAAKKAAEVETTEVVVEETETADLTAEVLATRDAGFTSAAAIATLVGVDVETVEAVLAENPEVEVAPEPVPDAPVEPVEAPEGTEPVAPQPTEAQRAEAVALREAGRTLVEIAEALMLPPGVLSTVLADVPRGKGKKKAAAKAAGEGTPRVKRATVTVTDKETPVTCTSCGETKPARCFPTVTGPTVRETRCRACRDAARKAA